MIAQNTSLLPQTGHGQHIIHPAANPGGVREDSTLVVDDQGRIRGCGPAVEDILGASHGRLLGRHVSAFIAGLFREGSSPSYNARYLVHLCASGQWQKFEATDARGRGFAVGIKLLRKLADGKEVFVLDLRRPELVS